LIGLSGEAIVLFVPSLSSCHKKAKVAIYFGRVLSREEFPVSKFSGCFFDFFSVNLLLVWSH